MLALEAKVSIITLSTPSVQEHSIKNTFRSILIPNTISEHHCISSKQPFDSTSAFHYIETRKRSPFDLISAFHYLKLEDYHIVYQNLTSNLSKLEEDDQSSSYNLLKSH